MHAAPRTERDARQRWATPAALVRGVERMSGTPIVLDVCAEAETAKAPLWLGPGSGIAEDGLAADWWRIVYAFRSAQPVAAWCNPPFAAIDAWTAAARTAAERGGGDLAVWLLVPPRTDQLWWHGLVLSPVCHLTSIVGRVAFEPPDGVEGAAPPGPVVLWQVGGSRALLPRSVSRSRLMEEGSR